MALTASAAAALNPSSVINPIIVADFAANVATHLDALHTLTAANKLSSITLSDAGTPSITITSAKLIADFDALLRISNINWTITLSSTITATQVVSASQSLFNRISPNVTVSDTSGNILANIINFQTRLNKVASITLTDNAPVFSLTAAQLSSTAPTLLKIISSYAITLVGTATVAQAVAANATVLGKLTAGFAVSDTATAVSNSINALQALSSKLSTIALTGTAPALSLTAAAFAANVGALAKITTSSYSITILSGSLSVAQTVGISFPIIQRVTAGVIVSDTSANVGANIDALQARVAQIASVALIDNAPVLSLTVTRLLSASTTLLKITGDYAITLLGTATAAQAVAANPTLISKLATGFAVADTAASISANLAGLQALTNKLLSIALTGTAPALSLTAAVIVANANALGKITTGSYTIAVSSGSFSVAQAIGINLPLIQHVIAGIIVSDTSANVGADIDALQARVGNITSVALTDSNPVVLLTAGQLLSAAPTLLKVTGGYAITLVGTATATQALTADTALVAKLTTGFAVSDTAANISANIAGLQALAGRLASIALTGATPTFSLTAASLVTNLNTLVKITTSSYTITISSGSLSVSQTVGISPTLLSHLNGTAIIADTSGNVEADIDALQLRNSAIASITLTNSAPVLVLTATQLIADSQILLKITDNYGISLSGTVTTSQVLTANTTLIGRLTNGFVVSDTSSIIASNLDALQALGSALASIALTDTAPILSLTSEQLIVDSATLLKISSNYSIAISATATVAQTMAANSTLIAKLTAGLTIADTSASVGGALDALQALSNTVSSIALTDTAPIVPMTVVQLIADSTLLLKISGNYGISISGTATVAQALGADTSLLSKLTTGLAIADIAANVRSYLDGLQVRTNSTVSITLTDGPAVFVVTAAELTAASATLQKIGSPYGITVSGTATATQAVTTNSTLIAKLTNGFVVSDTADNVNINLAALQTLAGALNTVTVTGSTNAAQAVTIATSLTTHLIGTIAVTDTGANVLASLAGLLANNAAIGTITLSDSATPLSLTSAAHTTNSAVLGKISSYTVVLTNTLTAAAAVAVSPTHLASAALTVSDTASNVNTNLAALQALAGALNTVTVTGSTNAAQAVTIATSLTTHLIGTVAVTDTGANVIASLAGLLANNAAIGTITLSDSATPLSLTSAALTTNSAVLGKISSYTVVLTNTLSVAAAVAVSPTHLASAALTVSDTASNVNINLAALQTLAGALNTVTVTGSTNAAQAVTIATSLTTHLIGTVAVTDTGANVAASLAGLFTNLAHIGTISLSSGTTLSLAAATLIANGAVLSHISGSYSLVVSDPVSTATADAIIASYGGNLATPALTVADTAAAVYADRATLAGLGGKLATVTVTASVTAAQAVAIAISLTTHLIGTVAVTDTGANVIASLAGLLANNAAIGSITLSDSATPLSLTSAALTTNSAVLGKISSYTVVLTNTLTAAAAVAISPSHLASAALTVSDTASNVNTNLAALQTLANALNTVTVTGSTNAAQAVTIATSLTTHLIGTVAVTDTGANVLASLAGLFTNLAHIGTISLSSGTTLSLAAATLIANGAVLSHISGSYSLVVSDPVSTATADAIITAYGGNLATPALTVADTAAAVYADRATLAGLGGKLATVTVTASVTAAQAVAIATSLTTHLIGTIAVSDTGANVAASLAGLLANNAAIGTIVLSDSTTPLSLTSAALTTNSAVLGKISSYTVVLTDTLTAAAAVAVSPSHLASAALTVSDTASNVNTNLAALQALATALNTVTVTGSTNAAQAVTIATSLTTHLIGTIAVSDTGANVAASLAGLLANNAAIGTIVLSDSTTPLSLTSAALTTNSAVLGKISSYTVVLTDTLTAAAAVAVSPSHLASAALTVSDTASNVNTNLAALQALATALNTVTVTGSTNAAQAVTIATSLTTHLIGTIAVSDTGANVAASLAGLLANNAAIGSITLSDSATPLSLTSAALTTNSAVLGKISSYTVVLTNTLTAAAAVAISPSHLASAALTVSDTASNVNTNLAALQTLANALNTVTVTGSTNAAQAVTIATSLTTHLIGTVAVTDTGANVLASLAGLFTNLAHIGTISLSSGTTLSLAAATLIANGAVLSHISGSYSLVVSDPVSTATADAIITAYGGNLATPALTVADTAAAVYADRATLAGLGGKLATVTVTASVTAAQAVAIATSLTTHLIGTIAVSDTGANVAASLAGLLANNAAIGTIVLSDSTTPLSLTSAALTTNSAVLGKISSYTVVLTDTLTAAAAVAVSPSHLASAALTVSDTASNVNTNLAALQALATALNTVTVTGSTNAAQAVTIATSLTTHLIGTIAVSDTGANVAASLAGLLANNAAIGTIVLSDSTTPLSLTSAALTTNSAVLGKISSYTVVLTNTLTAAAAVAVSPSHLASAALTVSDTASNVNTNLAALQALATALNTVTVTGSTNAAQAVTIATSLTTHLIGTIAVTDTGANVAASLAGLLTNNAAIGTIVLSDSATPLSLTSAALTTNSAVLGKISSYTVVLTNTLTAAAAVAVSPSHLASAALTVSDTASNVNTNLAALQALATALNTVTVTGSTNAAQAVTIATSLTTHLIGTIAVSDTGANVLASLAGLFTNLAHIGTISLSSGTTLSLAAATLIANGAVLSHISGSYSLVVSGTFNATQATVLSTSAFLSHLPIAAAVVLDTAANISAALSSLQTLADTNKLGSITLTDAGPVVLTVTPAQLSANANVIRKIATSYTLGLTEPLTAAQATSVATILKPKLPSNLAVLDSAANVVANLDELTTLAATSHLGTVAFTDSGTPVLEVTADQLTSDAAALAKLTGSYQLLISGGVTAHQAALFAADIATLGGALTVVDSAGAVATDLSGLEVLATQALLGGIIFTDAGIPNLTLAGSAFASGLEALATIVGAYTVTVTGTMSVAQIGAVNTAGALSKVTGTIAISDTAGHVGTGLDALQALGAIVGSIALTGVSPSISLTTATLLADQITLAKISGAYTLVVTAGTLTVAQEQSLSGTIVSHLAGLVIADSAANVSAALDSLQTLAAGNHLASVAFSDTGIPSLQVTAGQLTSDSTVLPLIAGTYGLLITSGSVDVASNITTLKTLADANHLASITFPSGALSLTLTPVQAADTALTALFPLSYTLTITGGLTVTQLLALPASVQSHLSSVVVSGSASDFSTNLDALQAQNSHIASVSLTGSPATFAVTADQLWNDAAILTKIIAAGSSLVADTTATATAAASANLGGAPAYTGLLRFRDSAANVTTYLDNLQTLAAGSHLGAISLTDTTPVLTLSAATLVADATALGQITGSYTLTIASGTVLASNLATLIANSLTSHLGNGLAISDTSANVASALADVQAQADAGHLASIAFTNGSPSIALTAAQAADAALTALFPLSYTLTITGGLTVTQLLALPASVQSHLSSVVVSGSASDFSTNLDALQAQNSHIASVSLTGSPATFAVTADQLWNDAAILTKIIAAGSSLVADTTATATAAASANLGGAPAYTGLLRFRDSAANVTTYLDNLQTLAAGSHLGAISLTDTTPVLTLSAATLVADATALGQITGSYTLTIASGTVLASNLATLIANSLTSHLGNGLAISDTSANVASALADVQAQADAGHLASIAFTNGSPSIALTAVQAADTALTALFPLSYTLTITGGLTVTQLLALPASVQSHLSSVVVSGSASDFSTNLDALQAQNSHIASVSLTGSPATFAVTADQLWNDAAILTKIIAAGSSLVADTTATATAAASANLGGAPAYTGLLRFRDSAANVTTYLDNLQTLAAGSHLGAISLTDTTPVLTLSAATLVADATALGQITGSYTLTIASGTVLASNLATLIANSLTSHLGNGLAISDTSANVASALADVQAQADAGHLASIAFTNGSPSIALTAVQAADTALTALFPLSYTLTITGGLTVTQLLALPASVQSHLSSVVVSGSASDFSTNLDALQAQNSHIASVSLTGSPATFAVTADQLWNDAAILTKIIAAGSSLVADTTATATAAASANLGGAPAYTGLLRFRDSAANVTTYLDNLQTLAAGSHLGAISLTDTTPVLTLSAATLVADATALGQITGSYTLTIASGTVLASNLATLIANSLTSHLGNGLAVTDTATHMITSLSALQQVAAAGHLGTLTMTTSAGAYNFTAAQATSFPDAINAITGATGARANATMYISGTSAGDTVDVSPFTKVTDISLGANSATMSFVSNVATVTGTPDIITLGSAASTVEYTVTSGTEVITGFQFGKDVLNLALDVIDPTHLQVTDVTLNGTSAVALRVSDDPTRGVILVNPISAATLTSDHLFTAGNHIIVA